MGVSIFLVKPKQWKHQKSLLISQRLNFKINQMFHKVLTGSFSYYFAEQRRTTSMTHIKCILLQELYNCTMDT